MGIIFAVKAAKEGIAKVRKFVVLGILEILSHSVGVIVAVAMFIAGMGV